MRSSARRKQNRNIGLVYILPWIIGFAAFQLIPFGMSLFYSFGDVRLAGVFKFVGLANYVRIFTEDPYFGKSALVTLRYVLYVVPGKLLFALLIALMLNMQLKAISLFRTVYYLPSILGGSVAVSALWRAMFSQQGSVNRALGLLGIGGVSWLGSPDIALFTISTIEMWQFGSSMVIFLAALKQVPSDLYDAASVDGSKRIRTFFNITLPMISPVLFFNLIMQTINALQNFTSAMVVTRGGPLKATYVLGIKLYEDAFAHYDMGYASAESWVMFIAIVLLTALIFKSSNLWVFYGDGRNGK